MKMLLCLFVIVAAPLAARAQYGPGGNESLATHIYWGEVEAKRQQELQNSQTRYSAPRGKFFRAPKYGLMFTGKTAQERRANKQYRADTKAHDGWKRYPGGYRGKDGQIMKPDGTVVGNKDGQAVRPAGAVEPEALNGRPEAVVPNRAPHTGPMTHDEEKAARRAARKASGH